MSYKKQIDALRMHQRWTEAILNDICDEIRQHPGDLKELLEEHENYIKLFMEYDKIIMDLQPFWRRFLGAPY